MQFYTDGKRHLVCLPYSVDNLHKMAEQLGIGKHWFHNAKNAHYDIPKRLLERIESQSIKVTSKDIVRICAGSFEQEN